MINKIPIPKKSTVITQTIIGSVGAIIDLIIFSILLQYFSIEIAFISGFTVAIIINYILTIKYSFKSLEKRKTRKSELIFFCISCSLTGLVQYSILYLLQNLNIDFITSKATSILISYILSFSLKWLFVFGKDSEI